MFESIDYIKLFTQIRKNMANNSQTPPPISNDLATKEQITEILKRGFKYDNITSDNQETAVANLSTAIWDYMQKNSNSHLKERLDIYWSIEDHYLNVLKDYKEELKFVASMQEDLRKERAKFFAETLNEVSKTLAETKVDQSVQSSWIQNLVQSYTQSLDMSSELIQETTVQTLADIKKDVDEIKKTATKTE